jgi:DNA-directed RNA polymerase specialized sigma subunit
MAFTPKSQLEKEYAEPYAAWKKKPGPETNAAMLSALRPTIEGAVRTHVGTPNPLIVGRAKLLALEGLKSYDPAIGKLQTHLYNHMQGLKRINRQQTQIIRTPERISLERQRLRGAEGELTAQLGRDPTDTELSDFMSLPMSRIAKIKGWKPAAAEGSFGATPDSDGSPAVVSDRSKLWAQIVYDELDDYHRKIMEHSMGLHGRPVLSNQQVAAKMLRSPGAISQAKARIQQKLDEQYDLEGVL